MGRRAIISLRCADTTVLSEDLEREKMIQKVKDESEKMGLDLNIRKREAMTLQQIDT